MRFTLVLLLAFFQTPEILSQDQLSPPIIFIYDASGSMWGQIEGKTKMEIASGVLSESISRLPEDQQLGLVAYGHRVKSDCEDVEFLVGVGSKNQSTIHQSLGTIKPLGKTPLAFSAIQVIDYLRKNQQKATIILVTDGIESCNGDICEVIKNAKSEGIDFKLHIIGFGLKPEETDQLICAAQAGDGQYFDAANAEGLSEVLQEATAAPVGTPSGNVSVFATKNGKPIDAYIRAKKAGSDTWVTSSRTYADTSFLYLPSGTYDLEVKPLENSDVGAQLIEGVESRKDKIIHKTVSFDAGRIMASVMNNDQAWDAVINVYPKGSNKSVARGRTYGKTEIYEVNPGRYDIEIKAMVLKGEAITYRLEDIEVTANAEKQIAHNFQSGKLMIGANSDTGLVDAVVSIVDTSSKRNVANSRTYTSENNNPREFLLSPGTYLITIKALGEHKGKTETLELTLKAGDDIERLVKF